MSKVTVTGITNFRNRLQKLKQTTSDELALAISKYGSDYAQSLYSGDSIMVSAENTGNGKAKITAEGKQVAFLEYGTGLVGKGSYEGNLPTEPITFESAGKTHTTNGWEYYYDNPDTKATVNNVKGWFWGNNFSEGWKAQAQMWHTAEHIRKGGATKAIKQYLDEKDV